MHGWKVTCINNTLVETSRWKMNRERDTWMDDELMRMYCVFPSQICWAIFISLPIELEIWILKLQLLKVENEIFFILSQMLWESKTGGFSITKQSHHVSLCFSVFFSPNNFFYLCVLIFYLLLALIFLFLHLYIQLLILLLFTLNLPVSLFVSPIISQNITKHLFEFCFLPWECRVEREQEK